MENVEQNLGSGAAPAVQVAPQETLVPQSEVDKLAVALKHEFYERGKKDAANEHQAKQSSSAQSQNGSQSSQGGPVTREDIAKMIQEQQAEANRAHQQALTREAATQELNKFSDIIRRGQAKHPDYLDSVRKLNLEHASELVRMANSVPNGEDVLLELVRKPSKLGAIKVLYNNGQEELAWDEFKSISSSIQENEAALSRNTRQARPSTVSIKSTAKEVDSESVSLKNPAEMLKFFKKQAWAKPK